MPIAIHHARHAIAAKPRCFYLLVALLAMLVMLPFLAESKFGILLGGLFDFLIMLGAIVALGRSQRARIIGVLLAVPTVGFQIAAMVGAGMSTHFLLSKSFAMVFYGYILIHLLKYVFHPEVMSADKLYGAASAYLLFAFAWANLYIVLQYFYPGAFAFNGVAKALDMKDFLYFSFTIITTSGMGDISPLLFPARCFVNLEEITGVLYVAILISRLAGMYQPEENSKL